MNQQAPGCASYKGTIHPDCRVTVGRVPRKNIAKADTEYENTRTRFVAWEKTHWHYEDGLVREYYYTQEPPSSLGLSSVNNYHTLTRRKNGLKGITPKGRSTVREAAYLLSRRYGRRLGFYTLTCPYTDYESIFSFNQNIAYIQRSYFQEVKRIFDRRGINFSYVSVIEIQTERFASSGVPVLHIHYIAPCYMPGTWEWCVTANTLRAVWSRVCQNACGTWASGRASVDATVVRSSAVGYISKYMSKGGDDYAFLADCAPCQFPSQWWSISQKCRLAIRQTTVELPSAISEYVVYNDTSEIDHPLYMPRKRYVYTVYLGQEMCVGLSGRFSQEVADNLRPNRLFSCLSELL